MSAAIKVGWGRGRGHGRGRSSTPVDDFVGREPSKILDQSGDTDPDKDSIISDVSLDSEERGRGRSSIPVDDFVGTQPSKVPDQSGERNQDERDEEVETNTDTDSIVSNGSLDSEELGGGRSSLPWDDFVGTQPSKVPDHSGDKNQDFQDKRDQEVDTDTDSIVSNVSLDSEERMKLEDEIDAMAPDGPESIPQTLRKQRRKTLSTIVEVRSYGGSRHGYETADYLVWGQNRQKSEIDLGLQREDLCDSTTKIPHVSDYLKVGRSYLCLGGVIDSPDHFYMNPLESWNSLEYLQRDIQEVCKYMDEYGSYWIPTFLTNLKPGYPVLAKNVERPEKEYHRGRVVGKSGEGYYKVKLLDYGDLLENVPFSNIRYLKKSLVKKAVPLQAIRCRIDLHTDPENPWTRTEGKLLRSFILDKSILVHLKSKEIIADETVWTVSLHVYNTDLKAITMFHVEREVLKVTRGEEFAAAEADADETFTNPSPKISFWDKTPPGIITAGTYEEPAYYYNPFHFKWN